MLKKLTMLAMAVGALVAFAVPAAASANLDWDETGTIVGHGELTSVAEAGLITGPADVHFEGEVVEGSSTGLITDFEITGPVAAGPNCTAEASVDKLPWTVHLTTPDTMTITDVSFTNVYSGSCPVPFATVEGDVTLTLTGSNSASADEYEDYSQLFVVAPPLGGVDLTGDVTWSGPGVTGL